MTPASDTRDSPATQAQEALELLQAAQAFDRDGRPVQALQARFRAVTTAQRAGHWVDQQTTPAEHLAAVVHAVEQVRTRRAEIYHGSYADLRDLHGPAALERVDRALSAYLKAGRGQPADARQRPRFFYLPDLPSEPYLDPQRQPWAAALCAAFPSIREEALRVLTEDSLLEDFVRPRQGDRIENYLGGRDPAWEAFFFYRHGTRYDANHDRCPLTSRALESIELCRIGGHAPEICFSVLRPGTHIKPHYGVTNVRLVMHLPLVVPRDCALHLPGAGEHAWKEGELVMFDDTYQHESWNRSDTVRIILLMDCWHPDLGAVERQAIRQLIETIAAFNLAARAASR